MIAEHIRELLLFGFEDRESGRRRRGLEADRKESFSIRVRARDSQRIRRRIPIRISAPAALAFIRLERFEAGTRIVSA